MFNKRFRIHVLGLPHTKTTKDFTACAYTQKVWKFCKMMEGRGHYIMHYGHEDSNPAANENITVITNKVWDKVYGSHDYKTHLFKYDTKDDAYQTFYFNAIIEIEKRKQPGDIILPFWGSGVRPICDAHPDLCIIEPGIGYAGGMWSVFKIFESYAIYHAYCGLGNVGMCKQSWYDQVIPNYFDLDEFEYSLKKEDYFLYVGRVYDGKGVNIAIQATQAIGAKLKIAGQIGDEYYEKTPWPDHVEFIGYVDSKERKNLMKGAIASFLPSMYVEPFGGVQIENLLCGTPTITTDWGAFAENNIHGITGYRCRTFEDFVKAARDCQAGKIKSIDCRRQGENFSLEAIAPKYEKYFTEALQVSQDKGWYTIQDPTLYTTEWLSKHGYNSDSTSKLKKTRIATWNEPGWAIGRIHTGLGNSLSNQYEFTHFNWHDANDNQILWANGGWKDFDIILGNGTLSGLENLPKEAYQKMICALWSIPNLSNHFKEIINPVEGITWCSASKDVQEYLKETYGIDSFLISAGVSDVDFYPTKKVTGIKNIGLNGLPFVNPEWDRIKRPQMLVDIANGINGNPIFIHGKDLSVANEMYNDIDMYICTSTNDLGPYGIAEAAFCKIPVLSTKTGLALRFKSIKTFDTVEEAIQIINELNQDPKKLNSYIEEVYKELTENLSWDAVNQKYWIPVFENHLILNKR